MTLTMPSGVDTALQWLGMDEFPQGDEDALMDMGRAYNTAHTELKRASADVLAGSKSLGSVIEGDVHDRMAAYFDEIAGDKGLAGVGENFGKAGDLCALSATSVLVAKGVYIGQLVALEIQLVVDIALAVETLGASLVQGGIATALTRVGLKILIRNLVREIEQHILQTLTKEFAKELLVDIVKEAGKEAAKGMVKEFLTQTIANQFFADGYKVGDIAKKGVSSGVEGATSAATDKVIEGGKGHHGADGTGHGDSSSSSENPSRSTDSARNPDGNTGHSDSRQDAPGAATGQPTPGHPNSGAQQHPDGSRTSPSTGPAPSGDPRGARSGGPTSSQPAPAEASARPSGAQGPTPGAGQSTTPGAGQSAPSGATPAPGSSAGSGQSGPAGASPGQGGQNSHGAPQTAERSAAAKAFQEGVSGKVSEAAGSAAEDAMKGAEKPDPVSSTLTQPGMSESTIEHQIEQAMNSSHEAVSDPGFQPPEFNDRAMTLPEPPRPVDPGMVLPEPSRPVDPGMILPEPSQPFDQGIADPYEPSAEQVSPSDDLRPVVPTAPSSGGLLNLDPRGGAFVDNGQPAPLPHEDESLPEVPSYPGQSDSRAPVPDPGSGGAGRGGGGSW